MDIQINVHNAKTGVRKCKLPRLKKYVRTMIFRNRQNRRNSMKPIFDRRLLLKAKRYLKDFKDQKYIEKSIS
jgi:hypothetical protein